MIRNRYLGILPSVAVVALSAIFTAACSSGSGGAGAAPASPSTTSGTPATSAGSVAAAVRHSTTTSGVATIAVADSDLGQVLVNSQGRTLYLFKKDTGMTSTCSGACATAWPPLLVTAQPTPGTGANAALLGTARRSDGGTQVTYNGHPVYLFIKDHKAGDTNGQGRNAFGASWFAVTPAGNQVTAVVSSSSTTVPDGGAGGY
jgi:predicted lipoprotein with Yx(FWY)xxD motif